MNKHMQQSDGSTPADDGERAAPAGAGCARCCDAATPIEAPAALLTAHLVLGPADAGPAGPPLLFILPQWTSWRRWCLMMRGRRQEGEARGSSRSSSRSRAARSRSRGSGDTGRRGVLHSSSAGGSRDAVMHWAGGGFAAVSAPASSGRLCSAVEGSWLPLWHRHALGRSREVALKSQPGPNAATVHCPRPPREPASQPARRSAPASAPASSSTPPHGHRPGREAPEIARPRLPRWWPRDTPLLRERDGPSQRLLRHRQAQQRCEPLQELHVRPRCTQPHSEPRSWR